MKNLHEGRKFKAETFDNENHWQFCCCCCCCWFPFFFLFFGSFFFFGGHIEMTVIFNHS